MNIKEYRKLKRLRCNPVPYNTNYWENEFMDRPQWDSGTLSDRDLDGVLIDVLADIWISLDKEVGPDLSNRMRRFEQRINAAKISARGF